ncbi:MAG: excinuclease ABC subunit UvrC [Candidatus Bathyarchaeota archaeon]|uniref:excinuclease ABC subunit UvrC n=1 Tax=Candidatus Bathycorpusculum sp. TaxID=2994959 RepID=UPI002834F353|nr:excinuclease ABC subunit UvrC [Candidatus Termiticorpusculum sp.]MCL2257910.1 excinuclease ABC subunit UvrC [Candidatus Termiticorpusculum sp.]MCL2291951.1 excinuclease ABC subunit UvrC [Candidatus Termiticorpusculum sp.]
MIHLNDPKEFKAIEVPVNPGVYLFKNDEKEILYVGKAKNLRSRVKSYFANIDHPPKTRQLVSKIRNIDFIIVNNEVEALLLENKLIKQHTPKYNINLKDSKTYAYISLTRENYPRILTSRKVSPKLESFGPYTEGYTRQDLQRLVTKVFKLRTCKTMHKRACLNYHIGNCTAPCVKKITKEQYDEQVKNAKIFLEGKFDATMQELETQMQQAAVDQKFERAMELRDQIASIRLLTQRQIVDNEKRFDQDIMVFCQEGDKIHVIQMGLHKGVLLGKKEFTVDRQPMVEQEFLKAFYAVNQIPREILLNKPCWQDTEEKKALEEFLHAKKLSPVMLTAPKRGNKLDLVQLAEKNLQASLTGNNVLVDLQKILCLPKLPRVIECFDISNLGQEHIVAGMVRFTDAKPDKKNYRKFKIKTVIGQNDFASMHEVVTRRYKRLKDEEAAMPDLIIIDGGPGQVHAAQTALDTLNLKISIIGIAKENEEIHQPNNKQAPTIQLDKNSRMMLLIRQIRDATHDFSVNYNRKRREIQIRDEFTKKSL